MAVMNHYFWGPLVTMGIAIAFGGCLGLGIAMIVKMKILAARILAGILLAGFVISGLAFHSEHYICDTNVAANRDCHWEFE